MQAEKEKLRLVAAPADTNCTEEPEAAAPAPSAEPSCLESSGNLQPAASDTSLPSAHLGPAISERQLYEESDTPDELVGTVLDHRYLIERLRDGNELRRLYSAVDQTTGQTAFVYVYRGRYTLDSRDYHHFKIWMSQLAQMSHEELVRTHGFLNERTAYAVTEAVEGQSLQDIVDLEGKMPVAKALPLFIKVCKLLQSFHARNIAHDNLTLSNIVLVPNDDATDVLKLRCFALLDSYSPCCKKQEKARVGDNDVKQLAEAFYAAVCTQPDLGGLRPASSYEMPKLAHSVPRTHALPLELQAILLKAMHKDPARRHRSILKLAKDLNTLNREWLFLSKHGPWISTYASVMAVIVGCSCAWLEHKMHLSTTMGSILPVHRMNDLTPDAQKALGIYSNNMYHSIAGNLSIGANLQDANQIEMRILIAPDGTITQAKLLHSSGHEDVDKEAVAAVMRTKFAATPEFLRGRNLGMIFWFSRVVDEYGRTNASSQF